MKVMTLLASGTDSGGRPQLGEFDLNYPLGSVTGVLYRNELTK